MKILLLTPPMTQVNTPYPATAYLSGFLKQQGYGVEQADPAIELIHSVLTKPGLQSILGELRSESGKVASHPSVNHFLAHAHQYTETVDSVREFLQGKDPTVAYRVVGRRFLPEGPRFRALIQDGVGESQDSVYWAFGSLGIQDRARYLCTLYLDDLADVIQNGLDPRFQLSRFGEKLAASVASFDPIYHDLKHSRTWIDHWLDQWSERMLLKYQPDVVGMTVPFPGNVYGAFRIAKKVKELAPRVRTILGGGYVNTELRELGEPRVFEFFDYVTLDDGEKPLLCILESLGGSRPTDELLRTFVRREGRVVQISHPSLHDIPHRLTGTPTYKGLPLDYYLNIFEMLNPMHRIWSDGRWNKLTLAHGCYWRKCHFCDISLDYINRYDVAPVELLIQKIETLIEETGQTGFHFVDEAAPPAILKALAEELIRRKIAITWWGNIRFEKSFTPDVTALLARSGCIAVSGGLEVASDRLLQLMRKGVSVEQVARVTRAFTDSGIMVHAYLMYGFPTQTVQETIDALERVRQLFAAGCIQSAFWHRFSATAHSPIGKNPEKFGIQLIPQAPTVFARNDLPFEDPTPCDHDGLGVGLNRALYNYMHGVALDWDVREWFPKKGKRYTVPRAEVPLDLIEKALR